MGANLRNLIRMVAEAGLRFIVQQRHYRGVAPWRQANQRWNRPGGRLGSRHYRMNFLLFFFALLAALFSFAVFAGFFLSSFFLSMPLLIFVSPHDRG